MQTQTQTTDRAQEPEASLSEYIVKNVENIKNGSAVFKGQRITLDTELVRYHTCYSFLVLFMRRSSPFYLKDSVEASKAAAIAITATMLLGWWSLHGIIFTPITLVRNVLQSDKTTIRQLFEDAEKPPKKLHPALRILAVLFLIAIAVLFIWSAMQAKSSG